MYANNIEVALLAVVLFVTLGVDLCESFIYVLLK